MAIITFATTKGGAGKTTSAIALAGVLSRCNRVAMLDADPGHRLTPWAVAAALPERLSVFESLGERHIRDEIEALKAQFDYVLVDLEGAATRTNAFAMAASDLVIIPMNDSKADAIGAQETLTFLGEEAILQHRTIPVRILFTRTKSGNKSRSARLINDAMRGAVGAFQTEMRDLAAFTELYDKGGTLYNLPARDVPGVAKAIGYTELLAEEIKETLRWIEDAKRHDMEAKTIEREAIHAARKAKAQNNV